MGKPPFLVDLHVNMRFENSNYSNRGEDVHSVAVLYAVRAVSVPVLTGILDGGDEENEGEGEHGGITAEDGQLREPPILLVYPNTCSKTK